MAEGLSTYEYGVRCTICWDLKPLVLSNTRTPVQLLKLGGRPATCAHTRQDVGHGGSSSLKPSVITACLPLFQFFTIIKRYRSIFQHTRHLPFTRVLVPFIILGSIQDLGLSCRASNTYR